MRRALHDGGRGIAPSERPAQTSATKAIPATRATTVLATGRGAPKAPVQTRRPRQGPPRTRPAAAGQAASTRSKGRSRLVGVLLGLLAVVIIIVAVVALTSPSATEVRLRNVVYPEIQQAAAALRQLVSENTK
jgi:hypothetical protein